MQQCRFCGTFNEASVVKCMTCDTALSQSAQMPNGSEEAHTRPLTPAVQVAEAQFGGPNVAYGRPPMVDHTQQISRERMSQQPQDSTAAFGAVIPSSPPEFSSPQTEVTQRSPREPTEQYQAPNLMAESQRPAVAPQFAANAAMNASQSPSSPALEAFESAPSGNRPTNEGYQVDFAGLNEVKGVSSKTQTLLVFLGLLALGAVGFIGVMIFSGPNDDDKKMAGQHQGPDLSTPKARTLHALKQAKTHIKQQRWKEAQQTLITASSEAPTDALRDEIQALKGSLKKEKHAYDWFHYALSQDKKGNWSQAYTALKKIDPTTKLSAQAKLLEKRIRKTRLSNAMQRANYDAKRKRYSKSYIRLLRIEQVEPKYKRLRRTKRKVLRKLKRYLRKRRTRCRRRCRRRYRRRRHRSRKKKCYAKCSKRYKVPVLAPVSLQKIDKTIAKQPLVARPKARTRKVSVCQKRCHRYKKRYVSCRARCSSRRVRLCKRYYRRKYRSRRTRSRRNRYIRKKCIVKRYLSYCNKSRSRRACRRSYRKFRRCSRKCK